MVLVWGKGIQTTVVRVFAFEKEKKEKTFNVCVLMFNRAHGKGGTSVKAVDSVRGGDRGASIPTAIPIAMTAITSAVLNNNSVKFPHVKFMLSLFLFLSESTVIQDPCVLKSLCEIPRYCKQRVNLNFNTLKGSQQKMKR